MNSMPFRQLKSFFKDFNWSSVSVKNQPKISGCVRTRPQGTEHGAGKRRSRGAEVAVGKSQRPQNARGGCGIAQQLHAGQAVTVVLGGQQKIPPA